MISDGASIVPVGEADLTALAGLAATIWRASYPGIISPAQIEYMLGKMYSLEVLQDEIRSRGIRFYQLLVDERLGGFASIGPTEETGTMKLHKLYLLPELQGRGLGSRLLKHCETEAMRLGAKWLVLAVNKRNSKAITAYQRNGFETVGSVIADIGGGFVMDDFIMAKRLAITQAA